MANTTINFTIRALDGTVVPLTQFQIESGRLNTGEIPDVMPATTSFMTDANGQATVSLTVTEAPYYISKLDGTTDKVISYKFFVPESISPISGEMLYVDLGKNSKFYNDKSVAALIEAKIVAVNARNQVQLYIASNIATKLAIDAVALQVQNEHVAIQVLHDSTQAIVNTAVTTINTNTAAQVANVKVITDPWLGTKSVAPTVRNDSTPLQNGDEYFDTVAMGRMAYFNGTWYVSGVSNVTNTLFSGNGITTGFVLPVDPHGINNTVVYIDSVYQQKSTYSVSGTNITFSTAPLTGTNNIDVTVAAAVVIGTLPASGVTFTPSGTLSSTNVQAAITELVTDLAASSGSSMVGYLPAGTGAVSSTVQSKLRESVSVLDFGAVGDGVTDNVVAFALAAATVTSGSTLNFPDGTYLYSGGLVFSLPITLTGSSGAILNYTGAGKAVTLGPSSISSIGGADYGAYVVDGLTFTGGTSMTHGIYVPSWVLFPKFRNIKFYRFGGASSYSIFCQGMNWQVLVKYCEFMNDQAVARNFLRTDGYAVGLGWDSGNSHLTCIGNNISAISGYSVGVGIAHTGAGDIIIGNKIEGFSPNIRSGSGANTATISKNYFEVITGNCIEFGDVAGGYNAAAYVSGLTIDDNYCNMHALDGSGNTGSFLAPSAGNTATGLKFANVINNKFGSCSQVIPIVKLNNVGSQIGNSGSGNNDGLSHNIPYLRSIANNLTAWLGEGAQALGLSSGVSTPASPQLASASLDSSGVVHLSGQLQATTTSIASNTILAALPTGYIPSMAMLIPVYDTTTLTSTYLAIGTGGGISCGVTLTSSSLLELNGVSFSIIGA